MVFFAAEVPEKYLFAPWCCLATPLLIADQTPKSMRQRMTLHSRVVRTLEHGGKLVYLGQVLYLTDEMFQNIAA